MRYRILDILTLFSRFGVVHREEIKNDLATVSRLVRLGLVRKVWRKKKVFYELTEKALPLLEARRRAALEEAKVMAAVHKPPSAYHALLEDVRFLDEHHDAAKMFLFLGDWQLTKEVTASQLKLAQFRYYQEH